MSRRFFELAVRVRRLAARTIDPSHALRGSRLTAHRQLGADLTQFSFRLAFMIDLAYVGIGALGGAAVGRATIPNVPPAERSSPACDARASTPSIDHGESLPNVPLGTAARPSAPSIDRVIPGVIR